MSHSADKVPIGCANAFFTFSQDTHEPTQARRSPIPAISGPNRVGTRSAELSHPVQHIAGDPRFGLLCVRVTSSEPTAEDRLVPEERVLDRALSVVVPPENPIQGPQTR